MATDDDSALESIARLDQFSCVVGKVIKSCGMVEVHVNHFIKSPGKDQTLVKHITRLELSCRLKVLRDLMFEESELKRSEVQFLYKKLIEIAEERNIIAHNPVVVSAPPTGPKIIDLRTDKPKRKNTPKTTWKRSINGYGRP